MERGSRNFGYYEGELQELQYRENFSNPESSQEECRRHSVPQRVENREQYGKRSRRYEVEDDEERNLPRPDYLDEFSNVNENMGHGNTASFPYDQRCRQHGEILQEPEDMAIGYMNRGYPPTNWNNYPAPDAMVIDRRTEVSIVDVQYQQAGSTWNTHTPFTVQNYPQVPLSTTENKDEIKPRKVWWYTTSRVFSAFLIVCNLVSDWLQASNMDDPIGDVQDAIKNPVSGENCTERVGEEEKRAAKQFVYFTIAGTVLAVGQLVNIIYQIVQNHRLPADTKIPEYIDERTEVFFINAFVEFPQSYLVFRREKNIPIACVQCGITLNSKRFWRFLNGLVSLASSFWRFFTHVNFSSSGTGGSKCSCSTLCERCAQRLGKCIKGCLIGCIKCLCPCCCCCIYCKTFFPCCCAYIICENCKCSTKSACNDCKCGPGGPSFFSNLATLPTGLVTFLYIYRVLRYFCTLEVTYIAFNFVMYTIIGTLWDLVF